MNCTECKNKLNDYFSKREKQEEIQKHLASCEKCRLIFEQIQALAPEHTHLLNESPGDFFITRCEAKLDNVLQKEESFSFFPKRKLVFVPLFLVLAIAIGFSLGKIVSTNSFAVEQETIVETEYSSLVSFEDYQSYYAE